MVGVDFKNDGNADDKQTIIDYSSNYNRILVNMVKLHAFFLLCSYLTLQDTFFNHYSQSGICKSCLVI